MAMLLSCAAVPHHAAQRGHPEAEDASRPISESTLEAVAAGVRTPALGGHAATSEYVEDALRRVRTKPEICLSLGASR